MNFWLRWQSETLVFDCWLPLMPVLGLHLSSHFHFHVYPKLSGVHGRWILIGVQRSIPSLVFFQLCVSGWIAPEWNFNSYKNLAVVWQNVIDLDRKAKSFFFFRSVRLLLFLLEKLAWVNLPMKAGVLNHGSRVQELGLAVAVSSLSILVLADQFKAFRSLVVDVRSSCLLWQLLWHKFRLLRGQWRGDEVKREEYSACLSYEIPWLLCLSSFQ